ncbi:hypothetical protein SERLA73DRAFT_161454 [Serpula lacrymans var. lacrymans S7.3]|uniref:Uncharacterized protein n=2 Tax=Serpula lacrymans var. lacrymans TaxID=341189 RepID=F8Q2J3_SERL3|nr:uncharacterized protein SERLADRAFT_471593 [Serpula lacrymans var. lacrymans S7.9]EGN97404.1 hypothetical protein SERLA73DRAFT_161454 [Serpula lacrymans var. lacrymans S7.3]EGO22994.1 hypothetical protein SERLADRAFT_471593 [Serpula lacrymans var. lacrymans S7.9]
MSTTQNSATQRRWPFSAAQTTGTANQELLCSLLTVGDLDEISNSDDFEAVERYITNRGRVDASGKTTCGVMFWLYPTGLYGPYHDTEEGGIEQHGTLITMESGIAVAEAMQRIRTAFRTSGIGHEHIAPLSA